MQAQNFNIYCITDFYSSKNEFSHVLVDYSSSIRHLLLRLYCSNHHRLRFHYFRRWIPVRLIPCYQCINVFLNLILKVFQAYRTFELTSLQVMTMISMPACQNDAIAYIAHLIAIYEITQNRRIRFFGSDKPRR
jgi:hypothetical protein